MNQPIILCGLGLIGWRVLEHLHALEAPIIIIEPHADPNDPRLHHPNITLLTGDSRRAELLEKAGIHQARGVVIVTNDDLVNISTALLARRLNANVRLVVRMFNQNIVSRLGKSVHNTVALSVSALSAPRLALRALEQDIVVHFNAVGQGAEQIADFRVTETSPLRGRTLNELLNEAPLSVIAHHPHQQNARLLLDVDLGQTLQIGDRVMLAGRDVHLANYRDSHDRHGVGVQWAGRFRRFTRIIRRTVSEIDWSVKLAAFVLLAVVLSSTLFYYFVLKRPPADSLYRTISVIATGADMRANELIADGDDSTGKVFTSIMRLIGVALIAAFTAIFTNYLLRARLGSVLEVRRVPDGGHVVVCGLGNVGFRVVEDLLQRGERVVVIELSPNAPFVSTSRRQGAAVIIGDATVPAVLRQARADTARAVIAVTANELVNLEIGLLMDDLNPQQRVVVRISDPLLADTLREAANVPHAVSIPTLAAPAFFAALFDDRVQSVFRMGDQELTIVDLSVQVNDPALAGRTLRSVAIDFNMVPLSVTSALSDIGPIWNGNPEASHYRLKPGDVVTVVTTTRSLARLVQREPAEGVWAVQVMSFSIPARSTLHLWLRQAHGCSAEQADRYLQEPPFILAPAQTRGQAEDWLRLLQRERVQATIIPQPPPSENA